MMSSFITRLLVNHEGVRGGLAESLEKCQIERSRGNDRCLYAVCGYSARWVRGLIIRFSARDCGVLWT